MLLENIAEISTGLVAKRKSADLSSKKRHKYKLLTLKSIDSSGWIDIEELEDFDSSEILKPRYISKIGDVITRLSSPYTTVVINEREEGILIPSYFVITRVDTKLCDPEYLAMLLNSKMTLESFSKTSMGTAIPIVRVGSLKNVDIPLLDLRKQKKIGQVRKLMLDELQLLKRLKETIEQRNKSIESEALKLLSK